jgi:hypothetical protein
MPLPPSRANSTITHRTILMPSPAPTNRHASRPVAYLRADQLSDDKTRLSAMLMVQHHSRHDRRAGVA